MLRNPMTAVVSRPVSARLHGYWLVADMDGTLVSTPSRAHGHYLPLTSSPCMEPISAFLQEGGNVCVVSTAGRRMWNQIFEPLKTVLFSQQATTQHTANVGTLYLCGFSGAALFRSCPLSKGMEEIADYRNSAAADGGTTILSPSIFAEVTSILRRVLLQSLQLMRDDPSYLPALSRKYHAPMASLVSDIFDVRKETLDASPLTEMGALMEHGRYLTETNDALLDVQVVPPSSSSAVNSSGVLDEECVAQLTVLGIPMARAKELFTPEVLCALHELGVHAKFQPNSVVIARDGLDKGACVRYLRDRCGMQLDHALAFGDIPESIDKPLTEYPPMRFISVSPKLPDTSRECETDWICVGDEERGTARFLDQLLKEIRGAADESSSMQGNLFRDSILRAAFHNAKE